MSYLGEMLSKQSMLKVNDVRVLALLKEMKEKGQIEIREHWSEITETVEYTADAYEFSPRAGEQGLWGVCGGLIDPRRRCWLRKLRQRSTCCCAAS